MSYVSHKRILQFLIAFVFIALGLQVIIDYIGSKIEYDRFIKNAIPVQAKIVDIDPRLSESYDVYVMYEVKGESYKKELGYYDKALRVGQELTLFVDKSDHSKFKLDPSKAEKGSFTFAFLFFGIAIFTLVIKPKDEYRNEDLL